VQTAPRQRFVRTAPRERFVQTAPRQRFVRTAPFVQYVRVAPRAQRRLTEVREVVGSPLMRAVYEPRRRASIAYHPAYLTGRIVEIRRDVVILQPITGREVTIRRYVPYPTRYRVNQYVTIPAVYNSGGSYAYACSPQYYPQVADYYSNYYGTQVAYVNGCYVPQNSYSYYPSGSYNGYAPYYGNNGYYNYPQQPYAYNNTYGTPYDNCVWSDTDNDGDNNYCAAQNSGYNTYPYGGYNNYPYNGGYGNYPYNGGYGNDPYGGNYNNYPYNGGYGGNGAYAPQQIQGVVVAKTGTTLMVLGANGLKPIFVNEAPALQSGYAVNGPVTVGQVIDAYGFWNGNMFLATALM